MKILLLGEYSGLNKELKNSLISLGHEVTLAASSDLWKNFQADINIGRGRNIFSYKATQFILPIIHLRKFVGFDIVHIINMYILPRFPLPNLLFLKFLKNNNGLVTLSGAGDEPFFVKFSANTMRYNPIEPHEKYDRKNKYYMRAQRHLDVAHKYVDLVDGVIPIMYEYFSTFCAAGFKYKTSLPIPIPIDVKNIKFSPNEISNKKITFFHGLNRPGFKGTFLIKKCFDELKKKYPKEVDCVIDGHMPFDRYLEVLMKTNVSVDQIFTYSMGMNALYSMAQGKVVAGGLEPESGILYEGELPPGYNLIPTHSNIMNSLELILHNKRMLPMQAEASREFIIKHHCPQKVGKRYIAYWKSL